MAADLLEGFNCSRLLYIVRKLQNILRCMHRVRSTNHTFYGVFKDQAKKRDSYLPVAIITGVQLRINEKRNLTLQSQNIDYIIIDISG